MKTRSNAKKLDDTIITLEEAHVKEQERYAKEKVHKSRTAAKYWNRKFVWEIVNKLTGKKRTTKGKIKAKNPEDHIKK